MKNRKYVKAECLKLSFFDRIFLHFLQLYPFFNFQSFLPFFAVIVHHFVRQPCRNYAYR